MASVQIESGKDWRQCIQITGEVVVQETPGRLYLGCFSPDHEFLLQQGQGRPDLVVELSTLQGSPSTLLVVHGYNLAEASATVRPERVPSDRSLPHAARYVLRSPYDRFEIGRGGMPEYLKIINLF